MEMEPAFHAVAVAAVPLNVTVLEPCVAPKLDPVIVTAVPTGPATGDRLVMLGPEGGGAFTTRVRGRVLTRQPLLAARVREYVPTGVEVEVVIISVEAPEPVMETGLKVAEAPAGKPLMLKATLPAKLLLAVVETP